MNDYEGPKTKRISVTFPPEVFDQIEGDRGLIKRSTYVSVMLEKCFEAGIDEIVSNPGKREELSRPSKDYLRVNKLRV